MAGRASWTATRILALAALAGGAAFAYLRFLEPRLDAQKFADLTPYAQLKPTGEPLGNPSAPYRIGKVLLLWPARELPAAAKAKERRVLPPRLHPAWYRLDRDLRARRPTEVRTVIHLVKTGGEATTDTQRAERADSIFDPPRYELVVFDWHKRRWIGTRELIGYGESWAGMNEEQREALEAKIAPEALVELIRGLPEEP